MSAPAYLVEGAIFLTAAVIAVPLFKRLGLGSVLGYLIAGIVIGPSMLQLIPDPERVFNFAEFGVVMLLFVIGLQLEPKKAWDLRRPIFGMGGLQVLATLLAVWGTGVALGLGWEVALVAGMGIAMSSTAIGLATLQERHLMGTAGGRASFAVLLFQDIAVIPLFLVLALLAPEHGDAPFSWRDAVAGLLVIAAIIVASRTVVRPLMRVVAQTGMRELFFAFALLLVIGVALAVQAVGLSMALGTFLAGVLLADSEYRYELQLDIEPAKGLLLGLFFIAVGMSVDLQLVMQQPLLIGGLAAACVALKAALLFGLARLFEIGRNDASLFAVALSQIGEFAFVFFGLALTQGTLDRPTYNLLNAIVAVSMLLTPLLFVLHQRLARAQPRRAADAIRGGNPVIVAGFGRFGQVIVRLLNARGYKTTLVDHDPTQVDLLRSFGWQVYYGDAGRIDLLEKAGIAEAKLFVIAIDDPQAALRVAKIVRQRWPDLPIVARARSRTDAYEFRDIGINAVRETFHSALEAATQSLRALGESAPAAARMARQFEQHDRTVLEQMRRVWHDRAAVISVSEQGRKDLATLLSHERGGQEGSLGSVDGGKGLAGTPKDEK